MSQPALQHHKGPSEACVALDTSALDAGFKAHALRGTGRYVRELQRYFASNPSDEISVVDFPAQRLLKTPVSEKLVGMLPAGRMTFKQQFLYPGRLGSQEWMKQATGRAVDAIHFPAHIDAPARGKARYIVTVLDLIPIVLGDLYRADRPGWRFALARKLELDSIKNASLVLAISENTARDVERYVGVPAERIVVTPLGVDDSFFEVKERSEDEEIRLRYGIPSGRDVVLYLGGIDQRKNTGILIETFAAVMEKHRAEAKPLPVLVLAGNIASDDQYPRLLEAIERHQMSDQVCLAGYVPDEDLLRLFGLSRAFYFPSLYEGFGLTPLEAMAAGVPVVSSNTSAMPEVLGEAAVMVNPDSVQDASSALSRILSDREFAEDLSAKGRLQARKFRWSRTGELTLNAYKRLVCSP